MKLSTQRKHLTNVLKMVAYQIESDLLELIRPHYRRVEEEGRTLIHSILQDAADIEPNQEELRITLAPLSSPHRTRDRETSEKLSCEGLPKMLTDRPQFAPWFALVYPQRLTPQLMNLIEAALWAKTNPQKEVCS